MKRKTQAKPKTVKPRAKRAAMPKFFAVDEEMKHRAALLEAELASWPDDVTKRMFGMVGCFRKKAIFAAVPRTRTLRSPQSIIFKLVGVPAGLSEKIQQEPRIAERAPGPGAGWHSFELRSGEDLKDALWWLNQAYNLARK